MITIELFPLVGSFAENKDIARDIRQSEIDPELGKGGSIVLDFKKIESTTQSFIHALISESIRTYGKDVLDRISFKDCSDLVQKIIGIVVDYMQES